MNIQKSRLSVILSVMLLACLFVVPASAAEVEQEFTEYEYTATLEPTIAALLESGCTCFLEEGRGVLEWIIMDTGEQQYIALNADQSVAFMSAESYQYIIETHNTYDDCCTQLNATPESTESSKGSNFVQLKNWNKKIEVSKTVQTFTLPIVVVSQGLSDIVNGEILNNVLDEVVSLLPVIITFIVGAVGITKAISFIQGILHSA